MNLPRQNDFSSSEEATFERLKSTSIVYIFFVWLRAVRTVFGTVRSSLNDLCYILDNKRTVHNKKAVKTASDCFEISSACPLHIRRHISYFETFPTRSIFNGIQKMWLTSIGARRAFGKIYETSFSTFKNRFVKQLFLQD